MKAIQHGARSALIVTILTMAFAQTASARKAPDPVERKVVAPRPSGSLVSLDQRINSRVLRATAAPDTTVLGSWTFDGPGGSPDFDGWTTHDWTAQDGDFIHVEDFAGLGGGDFGKLYPLQGSQSIWCGARPSASDHTLCGYAALPGYGNSWDQAFCTASCLGVNGDVTFDYLIAYYSEPGYDEVHIEYDLCDDEWVSVRDFSGEQPPRGLPPGIIGIERQGRHHCLRQPPRRRSSRVRNQIDKLSDRSTGEGSGRSRGVAEALPGYSGDLETLRRTMRHDPRLVAAERRSH